MPEVYDHGTWYWDAASTSLHLTKPGPRELAVLQREDLLEIPDEHIGTLIEFMKTRGMVPTIDMETNKDLLAIINRLLDQTGKAMPKAK